MQELLTTEIEYQNPLNIYQLFSQQPWSMLLVSGQHNQGYSFVAIDPFQTLTSKNGFISFNNHRFYGNPFLELRKQLKKFALNYVPDLVPLKNGVIGYFGYDLYQHLEQIPKHAIDDLNFPDMALGFYDLIIGFDQTQKRAWIFASGFPETATALQRTRAQKRTAWLLKQLPRVKSSKNLNLAQPLHRIIDVNFTHENYLLAIRKIIDYIYAGDIFQANLSQRFSLKATYLDSPFNLYLRLLQLSNAPFSSYLNLGKFIIASASPERFIKLSQGTIETQPIKGTRPRNQDPITDKKLAEELTRSEKDRAENIMIVDLLRNDLSKVCDAHSIHVPKLCEVHSFTNVHHLVSTITGQLSAGKTAIDLLTATFPGGSITGAPKIRAMEIIAELELTQRGPYCGCLGYIGFNGDMDTAITIRSYLINDRMISFQVGGGIVADSDPEAEYKETLVKAESLLTALNVSLNIY